MLMESLRALTSNAGEKTIDSALQFFCVTRNVPRCAQNLFRRPPAVDGFRGNDRNALGNFIGAACRALGIVRDFTRGCVLLRHGGGNLGCRLIDLE